ncbi:hypothetical protein D3C86_1697520 [compost metagenome]
MLNRHAGAEILVHQRERAPEERQAHQGRLATLPGDGDVRRTLGLDDLLDVGLEQLVRHPEAVAGIERLLGQEEAILAVEVADGPRRLGQHVEGRRRVARAHRGRLRSRRWHPLQRVKSTHDGSSSISSLNARCESAPYHKRRRATLQRCARVARAAVPPQPTPRLEKPSLDAGLKDV